MHLIDSQIKEIERNDLMLGEVMLPEQFADMFRNTHVSPEHHLMVAILEDAIACYLRCGRAIGLNRPAKREVLRWEAERWIFEDLASLLPFSYVCEVLGIDHHWLRIQLEQRSLSGEPAKRYRQRVVPTGRPCQIEAPRKHVRTTGQYHI